MWITSDEVRLGKADVEFREMVYAYGERYALPDRAQSADELIDAVLPRWVLDKAWEWAITTGRQMSPVIAVSAPQKSAGR